MRLKFLRALSSVLTAFLCMGTAVVGAYAAPQAYTYSQAGYYQGAYIFELGWNLSESGFQAYTEKAALTLSDESTITVSFDDACKDALKNQAVLSDLKKLLLRLKSQDSKLPPLEKPLVVSIEAVGGKDLAALAAQYYANGELSKFSAIFSALDAETQRTYCNEMIAQKKTAFLSTSASNMDAAMIAYCAEKTYQEESIALFRCVSPYLTGVQKQAWIAKASKDGKNTFFSVLNADIEQYRMDSSGQVEIPVSLGFVGSGSEICLGAIPDLRNAKSIHYDVHGESGGSLFVGISPENGTDRKHAWIGSVESAARSIVWDSGKSIGFSKDYSGDYYVYIRSSYGACENITGSIVIEYQQ